MAGEDSQELSEDNPERERARLRAITDAEVQDIVRALRPFGVLGRDALAQECNAAKWQEGGFDLALEAAVAAGAIEELPGGFYKIAR